MGGCRDKQRGRRLSELVTAETCARVQWRRRWWRWRFWGRRRPEPEIGNNECRREFRANIYTALICMGRSEFPVRVSLSVVELRNTEGAMGGN